MAATTFLTTLNALSGPATRSVDVRADDRTPSKRLTAEILRRLQDGPHAAEAFTDLDAPQGDISSALDELVRMNLVERLADGSRVSLTPFAEKALTYIKPV